MKHLLVLPILFAFLFSVNAEAKKKSTGPSIEFPVAGPVHFIAGLGVKRSGGRRHQGVDLGAEMGTPVVAAWDGEVTRVGRNKLGGYIVYIDHPNGITTYYAHLRGEAIVNKGEQVRQGEVIGYVGESGNARGTTPHLHFEMRQGKKVLNPLKYIGKML